MADGGNMCFPNEFSGSHDVLYVPEGVEMEGSGTPKGNYTMIVHSWDTITSCEAP